MTSDEQDDYATLLAQHQALINHNRWLSDLGESTIEMLNHETVDTLLQHIADELVSVSCANGAYMHMVHETGDYLEVVAACGPLSDKLLGELRPRGYGLSAKAWETGEVQYAQDYNNHSLCVLDLDTNIQAVAIPLNFSGEILGVVFITAEDKKLAEHLAQLRQIANIASISIHQTRHRESNRQELNRTKILSELSSMMYQCQDWQEIVEKTCTRLFNILDLRRVSLYQVSEIDKRLLPHGNWTHTGSEIVREQQMESEMLNQTISFWSYTHNKPAFIRRKEKDLRESAQVHLFREVNGLGSTLCLPLVSDDIPWGLLTIVRDVNKRDFDNNDSNVLHTVVGQMSTVLQRQKLAMAVEHQAYHDCLTQLPNRRNLERYLADAVENRPKGTPCLAVLFFDLDGFKNVNDSLGHASGDRVLTMVAERLSDRLRKRDFIARLGGDEFAVVLDQLENRTEAVGMAERLIKIFDTCFNLDNRELNLGTSVGISSFPTDGTTVSDLIKHADMAMYQAKNAGGNRVICFDQSIADAHIDRTQLESDLKSALHKGQFELWFQPQVSIRTQRVCGVEALIRWHHPERGMIPPFEFIPLAEETGLIASIGEWVLLDCIRQVSQWSTDDTSPWKVGINVATCQFADAEFGQRVLNTLAARSVPPSMLQLEVTESAFMSDLENAVSNLTVLRSAGVRIAIDDFGTGYSSLSYLQDLPLDVLKIDRAFVNQLDPATCHDSLTSTIVLLARRFGLETVAEGVETGEQLDLVTKLGCDVVQGYYYSRPVPACELESVIAIINGDQCFSMAIGES